MYGFSLWVNPLARESQVESLQLAIFVVHTPTPPQQTPTASLETPADLFEERQGLFAELESELRECTPLVNEPRPEVTLDVRPWCFELVNGGWLSSVRQ